MKKPRLEIKKSTTSGLGLFIKEPILKGAFAIEYTGKIMTNKKADEHGGKYLFEINKRQVIDGSSRKNKARYINHSCRPNCETDVKKGKVLIKATRDIKAGEELFYNYGKEYFNDLIKPKGCKCPKCNR